MKRRVAYRLVALSVLPLIGGMALALVLAVRVVLDRNVASHRAWMLRNVLMTAASAANLLVAESVIQRAAYRAG